MQRTVPIESITAIQAQEYLKQNTNNRPLSKIRIEFYKRHMKAGQWPFIGDPIRFDVKGRLIDGQHRLTAQAELGITMDYIVLRDLPELAFQFIDSGAKRSARDIMTLQNESYPSVMAAATNYFLHWQTYNDFRHKIQFSSSERMEAINKNPKLRDFVKRYGGSKAIQIGITPSIFAVLHYLFSRKNVDAAEEYMDSLLDGIELRRGHPIYAIREFLIAQKDSKLHHVHAHKGHAIILGWNAIRENKTLSRIAFPAIPPKIL